MRTVFEKNLHKLQTELHNMTELVTKAVSSSVTCLINQDITGAEKLRKDDIHINNLRWEIEEQCIHLMATQQPVATDLREIIAILNIITELERIGDYAVGIAKIVIKLDNQPQVKPYIDIPRMVEIVNRMINSALEAYASHDAKAAYEITDQDDQVDELYHQVLRELISIMIENPKTITTCTSLIWVAHNLERIGDRATNICERVIFLATGEIVENTEKK